jgi:hypothetical protein
MVGLTYVSFPDAFLARYSGYAFGDINTLMLVSTAFSVLLFYPAVRLVTQGSGIKWSIQVGAVFVLGSAIVRLIPGYLYGVANDGESAFNGDLQIFITDVCIFSGQMLNGIALPFFVVPPAQLTVAWFPATYRTSVTGTALVAAKLGVLAAFYLPQYVTELELVLNAELHLAIVAFVCSLSLAFLPDRPAVDPNLSAVIERHTAPVEVGQQVASITSNANFMAFCVSCTLVVASWRAYCPLIPQESVGLLPAGYALEFTLSSAIAVVFGCALVGPIVDTFFQRKFKALLLGLILVILVLSGVFGMLFPHPQLYELTPAKDYLATGIVNIGWDNLLWISGIVSFAQGAMLPLVYEILAELCFPMRISGGIFGFLVATVQVLYLIAPDHVDEVWLNSIVYVVILAGLLGAALVKVTYKRVELALQRQEFLDAQDTPSKKSDPEAKDELVNSVYGSLDNGDFLDSLHIHAL